MYTLKVFLSPNCLLWNQIQKSCSSLHASKSNAVNDALLFFLEMFCHTYSVASHLCLHFHVFHKSRAIRGIFVVHLHIEPIAFKSGLIQTIYSYPNSNITAQTPRVQWVFRRFRINIQKQTTLTSLFSAFSSFQVPSNCRQWVMGAILLHKFQHQARRQGGFERVRSNPPFGPQKLLYTQL